MIKKRKYNQYGILCGFFLFCLLTGCGKKQPTPFYWNLYESRTVCTYQNVSDIAIHSRGTTAVVDYAVVEGNQTALYEWNTENEETNELFTMEGAVPLICSDADCIWLLCEDGNQYSLCRYRRNGNEVYRLNNVNAILEPYGDTNLISIQSDGTHGVYAYGNCSGIYHFTDGDTLAYQYDGLLTGTGRDEEGNCFYSSIEHEKNTIYRLAPDLTDSKKLTRIEASHMGVNSIYQEGKAYYLFGRDAISYHEGKHSREVCNGLSQGVNFDRTYDFCFAGDLLFLLNYDAFSDSREVSVSILRKEEKEKVRQEITLGMVGGLDAILRSVILDYNRFNEDYYIRVKDYAANGVSRDEAYSRFNTDIVSGKAPDMIVTKDFNFRSFAKKDLFYPIPEEFWAQMNSEEYWIQIGKAFCNGDQVYAIPLSYRVDVIASPLSLESGYRYDDLIEAFEQSNYRYASWMDGMDLFLMLVGANLSEYYDYETGEVDLEREELQRLMRFCRQYAYRGKNKLECIMGGEVALYVDPLHSYYSKEYYSQLFQCDANVIGYPYQAGDYGTMASFSNGVVSIMNSSDKKQEALEFLQFCLSESEQVKYIGSECYPICKKALIQWLNETEAITHMSLNDVDFFFSEEIDVTGEIRFLDAIEEVLIPDGEILDIMYECVAPYFDGQITEEEALSRAQTIVMLYIAENRNSR